MSAREPMRLDGTLATSVAAVSCVAVVLTIGAVALSDWSDALGVAIGGLVATTNLWIFAHITSNVLAGGRRKRIWGAIGSLKFLALVGGFYWLLQSDLFSGITLAIGYGALPVGITIGGIVAPRPDEDEEETLRASGSHPPDLVTAGAITDAPGDTRRR